MRTDDIASLDAANVEPLLFEKELVGKQCPFDLLYVTVVLIGLDGRGVAASIQHCVHGRNLLRIDRLLLKALVLKWCWPVSNKLKILRQ